MKKIYVFENDCLQILYVPIIIEAARWFQNSNIFHFLKAYTMKIIPRDKYLQRIIELNGTPDIKIITGIRRSGKSKLMQAYIEYLKSHVDNCNIIYIDFMDLHCTPMWKHSIRQIRRTIFSWTRCRCVRNLSWLSTASMPRKNTIST